MLHESYRSMFRNRKRSAIDALLLFSSTINLKQSAAFLIRFSRKASAVGDTRIVILARLDYLCMEQKEGDCVLETFILFD